MQRARANKQNHNVLSKWIKNYKTTSNPQMPNPSPTQRMLNVECWMTNVDWYYFSTRWILFKIN